MKELISRISAAWATLRGQPPEWSYGGGRLQIAGVFVSFSHCRFAEPVEFGANKGVSITHSYLERAVFLSGDPLAAAHDNYIAALLPPEGK